MAHASYARAQLTGGRLLARNTLWNLTAQILPIVAGIIAVPFIVRGLGVSRFGLLSLGWIVIGYFGLFDFGMGRALTKLVADKLGANDLRAIPPLAWTSLLVIFLLGLVGGVLVLATASWLVERALNVPQALQMEAVRSFRLLGLSIPFVTLTSGLRGILEAMQQFRVLSIIRIPMGIFTYLAPVAVLPFSHSLLAVIAVLVIGRILACLVHLKVTLDAVPGFRENLAFKRALVIPVFKFGGWMTVSNLISPLMVYLDRFLIGGLLSVNAVAYYATPLELVIRLTFIPSAIVGVLFPALAVSLVENPDRTRLLLRRGLKYIFLLIFPVACGIVALAPDLLRLWLGEAFAQQSSAALRWLAAGVLINCLAYVPFTLIQSAGRPDVTAKLHAIELPIYLLALVLLVRSKGIEGAALAWMGRMILDAALLSFYAQRLLPQSRPYLVKNTSIIAAAMLVLGLTTIPESFIIRVTFFAFILIAFVPAVWSWGLDPQERTFFLGSRMKILEEKGMPG